MKIKKRIKKIVDREGQRKSQGADSFDAMWQAVLEMILLLFEERFHKYPGQIIPAQIDNNEEWEFYINAFLKIDLPPDVCVALITPSWSKNMLAPDMPELKTKSSSAWERKAYSMYISHCFDRRRSIQVSLPGLESIGIDVYEDGKHFADYTYNSIDKCLNDLSNVIWTFFKPHGKVTEAQIIQYTENWFGKVLHTFSIESVPVHTEYSYVHNPKLIGLSPMEAALRAVAAVIISEHPDIEEAVKSTNEINGDMGFDDPEVTVEGLLNDNLAECQAFFDRITGAIDMYLDALDSVEGVSLTWRIWKNMEYKNAFIETARRAYSSITGKSCPPAVKLE